MGKSPCKIGGEEIPAEDLFVLPDALREKMTAQFEAQRLTAGNIRVEGTPRRLMFFALVDAWQSDLREVKLGPPKKVAFDSAGNPAPAGLGFAKNSGVPFES